MDKKTGKVTTYYHIHNLHHFNYVENLIVTAKHPAAAWLSESLLFGHQSICCLVVRVSSAWSSEQVIGGSAAWLSECLLVSSASTYSKDFITMYATAKLDGGCTFMSQ